MANWLKQWLGRDDDRYALRPLYLSIVEEARQPGWFTDGGVADTLEGRFEMVMLILSLAMLRLEALGQNAASSSVRLAELFVEDMEGQLRESGVGDVGVGKHVGKMMSALGGRLGAYREGLAGTHSLADALVRNLYAGEAPGPAALDHVMQRIDGLGRQLAVQTHEQLLFGIQSA